MEYTLACECGVKHRISKSQAGQELNCECGKALRVPALRELTALPPAEESEASVQTPSAWGGWRGPVMAVASTILLISGAFSSLHFLRAYLNDPHYEVEDYIRDGNEQIDLYGPDELSLVWTDFTEVGLKTRITPEFQMFNLYVEEQLIVGKILAAVAGAAALGAAFIWFTRPKPSKKSE